MFGPLFGAYGIFWFLLRICHFAGYTHALLLQMNDFKMTYIRALETIDPKHTIVRDLI